MCENCQKLMDKVDRLRCKNIRLRAGRRILITMLEDLVEEKSKELDSLREEKIKLEAQNRRYIRALVEKNSLLLKIANKVNY